jgi:protein LTV1
MRNLAGSMSEMSLSITCCSLGELGEDHMAGEAVKYGIYYDDQAYNYLQHLKPIGQHSDAVFIPSGTNVDDNNDTTLDDETTLNHATYDNMGELEGLDPAVREVLKALDDDDYEDDDFEDDFVVKLNREEKAILCPIIDYRKQYRNEKIIVTDQDDSDCESYSSDAPSYRGTSYAASLAITSIDNKFENILRMYDGEDDLDDVELSVDEEEHEDKNDALEEALNEFLHSQRDYIRPTNDERKAGAVSLYDEIRREMGGLPAHILDREESDTDVDVDVEECSETESKDDKFDCQSFITTYTNTENIPALIVESRKKPSPIIRLSRKTGVPILASESKEAAIEPEEENAPKINKGLPRAREETSEEKRARKSAIKSERRENRAHKKELKVHFKLFEEESSRK